MRKRQRPYKPHHAKYNYRHTDIIDNTVSRLLVEAVVLVDYCIDGALFYFLIFQDFY